MLSDGEEEDRVQAEEGRDDAHLEVHILFYETFLCVDHKYRA